MSSNPLYPLGANTPELTCLSIIEFACESGKCLYNGYKCDGNDDCGDNSDERDCRKFSNPKLMI